MYPEKVWSKSSKVVRTGKKKKKKSVTSKKGESAKALTQAPAKCVRPHPVFQTWQTDRHLFTKAPGL